MKYNWITLTYEMLANKYYSLRDEIYGMRSTYCLSQAEVEELLGMKLL